MVPGRERDWCAGGTVPWAAGLRTAAEREGHDMAVLVKRDGKTVATVEDSNAAFQWLLRHQPMSTDWAIKYEGYTVTDEDGRELPEFAKNAQR